MEVDGRMPNVPDDKTKHGHWIMPVETYEALLATYRCTTAHTGASATCQKMRQQNAQKKL